jgi:outer membrane receptor protein involved in Fe transport
MLKFALVMGLALSAFGQFSFTVRLKDGSGGVVPGAVLNLSGPKKLSGVSSAEGKFEFAGLGAASYRLVIEKEGFALVDEVVELSKSEEREIVLQPSAVAASIETVSRVAESTFRVPFFVSTVTKAELEKIAPQSFDDVLRTVPGLQHATQGNAFVRVATRGQRDTADVLTLVDGLPLRQFNGSADLIMLPLQLVQEADFVKGPSSSSYGRSAIAGVMNFNTVPDAPSPEAITGFLSAGFGSFGTKEGFGGGSIPLGKGRIAGSAVISASDWFQQNTGRDNRAVSTLFDQTFASRVQLRVSYLGSDVNSGRGSIVPLLNGLPLYGIRPQDNFGIPGARFEGTLHSVTPRVDFDLGSGFVLSNTFNFNRYRRFSTGGITILPAETVSNKGYNESTAVQDTKLNDTILTHRMDRKAFRSSLVAGFSYEGGSQDQDSPTFANAPTYRGPNYSTPVAGANAGNDPRGIRGAITSSFFTQTITAFHLQERFEFWRVGLTAGFRRDSFDQLLRRSDTPVRSGNERSRTSPRFGVDINALRTSAIDLILFGNYVEGFRPQVPSLSTLNNVIVAQLLRPELTKSLDTGFRFRLPKGTSFQGTYFHMRKVDGQRSFRSGPDDFFFVNATTRVKGFESELKTRVKKHFIWTNYSFQDSRHIEFRPTLTTNFSGFRVRMAPRHIAGMGGILQLYRSLTLSPYWSYVGQRPLRDNIVNPQVLPSYALFGASVSYDYKRMRFIVAATNVGDKYYIADDFSAQNAGSPGVPRRVTLQMKYRF